MLSRDFVRLKRVARNRPDPFDPFSDRFNGSRPTRHDPQRRPVSHVCYCPWKTGRPSSLRRRLDLPGVQSPGHRRILVRSPGGGEGDGRHGDVAACAQVGGVTKCSELTRRREGAKRTSPPSCFAFFPSSRAYSPVGPTLGRSSRTPFSAARHPHSRYTLPETTAVQIRFSLSRSMMTEHPSPAAERRHLRSPQRELWGLRCKPVLSRGAAAFE
jgi:hypothetical protein